MSTWSKLTGYARELTSKGCRQARWLRRRHGRRGSASRRTYRPTMEPLEPRVLLARGPYTLDLDDSPNDSSSFHGDFVDVNGTTFFTAGGNVYDRQELWKTDGTPDGCELVKDFGEIFV